MAAPDAGPNVPDNHFRDNQGGWLVNQASHAGFGGKFEILIEEHIKLLNSQDQNGYIRVSPKDIASQTGYHPFYVFQNYRINSFVVLFKGIQRLNAGKGSAAFDFWAAPWNRPISKTESQLLDIYPNVMPDCVYKTFESPAFEATTIPYSSQICKVACTNPCYFLETDNSSANIHNEQPSNRMLDRKSVV